MEYVKPLHGINKLDGANVLVLGGAGFIGSAVTRELVNRGAFPTVQDNLSSGKQDFIEDVDATIIKKDIQLGIELEHTDYVINLVAAPYIPECFDNPGYFVGNNIIPIVPMMQDCKKAGVKKVVYLSTSEVYGSASQLPMDENHPIQPQSTYAVTKYAAEQLTRTMGIEHDVHVNIVRQFNVIGERETHSYVVPEIISQLVKMDSDGVGKLKLGNIAAGRDFTYVEDAARAICDVLNADISQGEIVNSCTGKTYKVWEIASLVGKFAGLDYLREGECNDKIEICNHRLRPWDVQWLQGNNNKLKRLTGWYPRVNVPEALKRMIDYYIESGYKWPYQWDED